MQSPGDPSVDRLGLELGSEETWMQPGRRWRGPTGRAGVRQRDQVRAQGPAPGTPRPLHCRASALSTCSAASSPHRAPAPASSTLSSTVSHAR